MVTRELRGATDATDPRATCSSAVAASEPLGSGVGASSGVARRPTQSPMRNGVSPQLDVAVLRPSQRITSQRADQRGCPLELLDGEQSERVAHDHADAPPTVAAVDLPLEPRSAIV